MKFKVTAAFFSLTFLALGCSGGKGGGSTSNPQQDPGPQPKTKEEALQQLTPEQRAAFEAWKTKVVKSCNPAHAFGLNDQGLPPIEGIDGGAFLKANGLSTRFADENALVMVTGYENHSGIANSAVEETVTQNGSGYSIKAETKREGSHCEVFLFGQKVHELTLLKTLRVGADFRPRTSIKIDSPYSEIKEFGIHGAADIRVDTLPSMILKAFEPSPESLKTAAKKIGLDDEQMKKFLVIDSGHLAYSSMRLKDLTGSIWSPASRGILVADLESLQASLNGADRDLSLEIATSAESFAFNGVENINDHGHVLTPGSLSVRNVGGRLSFSLSVPSMATIVNPDSGSAMACLSGRAQAYFGGVMKYSIFPSTTEFFRPCAPFHRDIANLAKKSGYLKSLLPTIFAGVTPQSAFDYAGWQDILSEYAEAALEAGLDLSSELDPQGLTSIVPLLEANAKVVQSEFSRTRNMGELKNQVRMMGFEWAYGGRTVSVTRVGEILGALDVSAVPFHASTASVLYALGSTPYEQEAELAFARSLTAEYKAEAVKAMKLADQITYSGFSSTFDRVLQRQTPIEEFREWSNRFTTILNQSERFPLTAETKKTLVNLSIELLEKGLIQKTEIPSLFEALHTAVDPFKESSEKLLKDLKTNYPAQQSALQYARGLTPEMKRLAVSIRDQSKAAGYESWGTDFFSTILQKQPALVQLQKWENLWTSAVAFVERDKARVSGSASSAEWARKRVLDLAVKETWSGTQFATLEAIAAVARYKNVCDSYSDASSLADCVGLGPFSTESGKFFDPAYGNRYGALAGEFVSYLKALDTGSDTVFQWDFVSAFFGTRPIWSSCDAQSFNAKSKTLGELVRAYVKESEVFNRWELERRIKDTFSDCG